MLGVKTIVHIAFRGLGFRALCLRGFGEAEGF